MKMISTASIIPHISFHTGRKIPQVGLGTYNLRGPSCQQAIRQSVHLGYRHFDLASIYNNTSDVRESLEAKCKELRIPRSSLFIASKIAPHEHGYDNVLKASEKLLTQLNTPYFDLLVLLWPGANNVKAPKDKKYLELRLESWRGLETLKKQGKVRDIGVSNYLKIHLEHLLDNSQEVPVINQIEIHPFCHDLETISFCREKKIVLEAYAPLVKQQDILFKDPVLNEIAQKRNKSVAQIALRWGVQNGFVVIPKSKTEKYLKENVEIFDFELSREEIERINSLNKGYHCCWDPNIIDY